MKLFVRVGSTLIAGLIFLILYWHSPFQVQRAIQNDLSSLLVSKDPVAMAKVADLRTAEFLTSLPVQTQFDSLTDAQGGRNLQTGYEYYQVGLLQDRPVELWVQEDRDTWLRKLFPYDHVIRFQVR